MKQQILLFSLLGLISFNLFATVETSGDIGETPDLASDLLLDLRISTVLYRAGVERIELNDDEKAAIEDAEWIATVQEVGTSLLKSKNVSTKEIQKVDWRNVAKKTGGFFTKIYKKFRTSSRMNGVDVGIVLLLTNSLENLIPIILVGAGQPGLAAVSVFLPTGELLTGGYALFKNFLNQQKVKKLYGDKELYQFHRDLEEKVADSLHLNKDDTLLLPVRVVDNEAVLIAINKKQMADKNKISYGKARKYALGKGFTKEDLKTIHKSKEGKLMKLIMIVEKFYKTQDAAWLNEFEKQFENSVVKTDNLDSTKEMRTWSKGIKQVKDCEGFRQMIKSSPIGHYSREMILVIKEVFLQTLAEDMKGWKTGIFKRMRKGLLKIEVQINLEENPLWDSLQINRMDSMLQKACRLE